MKKVLLTLVALLTLVTVVYADEYEFNAHKEWENSLAIGYKSFAESGIKDSGVVALRFQKRIGYPFLAGVEAEGSVVGNVGIFRLGIPFTVRIPMPIERTKLDISISPGGIYATNFDVKVKTLAGAASAGLEAKYFFKSGYYIGIGGYYTVATDSKLNNLNVLLTLGF